MTTRLSSFAALVNATLIGVGLALIAGVIWVMGVEFLKDTFRSELPAATGDSFDGDTILFRDNGMAVIRGSLSRSGNSSLLQYRDLEGKQVEFDEKELLDSCWLYAGWETIHREEQWRNRVLGYSDQQPAPTFWYFVHDGQKEGRGYFVGYEDSSDSRIDSISMRNSRIGFIGLSGFRQDNVPEEEQFQISPTGWGVKQRLISRQRAGYQGEPPQQYPFSERRSILTQVYLFAEDALYRIDLKERTSQRILDLPASQILGVEFLIKPAPNTPVDSNQDRETQLLVRTGKEILFLDPQGSVRSRLPLPEPLRATKELTVFEPVGGKYYAVATVRKWEGKQFHLHCHPYCIDSQGQVVWTKDVLLATRTERQDMSQGVAYFWAVGAPLSADFGFLVIPQLDGMWSGRSYLENIQAACEDMSQSGWGSPYLLVPLLHLYTLLWAFIAWRRETRYGSSPGQRKMWVIFVYLLGLPALIGYLAHRKWPKLDECPSCKAQVPVDHDTCTACGNEWPVPARTGVEVIEA